MTDSRVSIRLRESDWNKMAISYTVRDGMYVRNQEREQLPWVTLTYAADQMM